MGSGSGIVTAVAQVAAVVWVQSLAQEFLYAVGTTKKEKEKSVDGRLELRFKWN